MCHRRYKPHSSYSKILISTNCPFFLFCAATCFLSFALIYTLGYQVQLDKINNLVETQCRVIGHQSVARRCTESCAGGTCDYPCYDGFILFNYTNVETGQILVSANQVADGQTIRMVNSTFNRYPRGSIFTCFYSEDDPLDVRMDPPSIVGFLAGVILFSLCGGSYALCCIATMVVAISPYCWQLELQYDEEAQSNIVHKKPENIELIWRPSKDLQLDAIRQKPDIFYLIRKPTETVSNLAVERIGSNIQYVPNPTEYQQVKAIESDIKNIKYISNPLEKVILKVFETVYMNEYERNILKEKVLEYRRKNLIMILMEYRRMRSETAVKSNICIISLNSWETIGHYVLMV